MDKFIFFSLFLSYRFINRAITAQIFMQKYYPYNL